MRTSFIISAALAASLVSAAPLEKRSSKGYVSLDVVHKKNETAFAERLSKRSTPSTPLKNELYYYQVTFEVGTPGQTLTALIDTGSSDLWVYGSSTVGTSSNVYDSGSSSTYIYDNSEFYIGYVIGSASGDWATDTITLGGATLTGQDFGVLTSGNNSDASVFGIGLENNESSQGDPNPFLYANVPQSLVDQGYTNRNVYSLFLDDLDASSGSILFGAVDSDKYTGDLYTVPLKNDYSFEVDASVSYGGVSAGSFQAVLDSGTSFTYLPDNIVDALAAKYGATWNSVAAGWVLPSKPTEGLEFNFSGATIKVSADEIWVPSSEIGLDIGGYSFLIFPSDQTKDVVLLGDTFLRSAYVVYDLDNLQVSLAQASYSGGSNIEVITGSIPGAKTAPGI